MRWTKEEIGVEIVRLYQAQQPLSYGEMERRNLRLLRAATRHFGTWRGAVEFAGLDYDQIRRYQIWTCGRITDQIAEYHRQGRDLSWRHVSTVLDPPLAAAAIRPHRFGSWESALRSAGMEYADIRKHRAWTAERVLAEVRQRHAQEETLRVSDVGEEAPALVAAARRHFGGWYEAVTAAGLDELEARRGPDGEWDEETARGEVSWAAGRS